MAAATPAAVAVAGPRPITRDTPLDRHLTLVLPSKLEPEWKPLARALDRRGARIVADTETPRPDCGHVLLVGALETNRWVRHLYFTSWLGTDILHPGPGGYELKTLCGAIDPASNVLLIGEADSPGLRAGVRRFLDIVKESEYAPCLFEASPSAAVLQAARRADAWLTPEGFAPYRGSWDGLNFMANLGACAMRTCRPQYLDAFKRECLAQLRMGPNPWYHAFYGFFILFFRALEQLPVWTGPERAEVVRLVLEILNSKEGIAYIRERAHDPRTPRNNHETRTALSTFYAADYLHRFYRLPEAAEALAIIDDFFRPQMTSSKPIEDSSGHQWKASIYDVAAYAMAAGKHEFFDNGCFRESALRALQNMSSLGQQAVVSGPGAVGWGPWTVLAMAAAVYEDPSFAGYLRRWSPDLNIVLEPRLCGDEPLRSFATSLAAPEPVGLSGAYASPLARLFYDGSDWYTRGFYGPKPPYEKTFDKITFRSGFELRDDYLLIDGISGGTKAYEDAGCIKEVDLVGHPWICALDAGYRETGMAVQNGVLLLRDGQRTPTPRYAELLELQRNHAGGWCRLRLAPYSGAAWTRRVLWRDRRYVVVLDQIEAVEDGLFQAEARWHILGSHTVASQAIGSSYPDGWAKAANFRLTWAGARDALAEDLDFANEFNQYFVEQNKSERPLFACDRVPTTILRLRLRRREALRRGDRITIGILFYAWPTQGRDPGWKLDATGASWRVTGPGGETVEELPEFARARAVSPLPLRRPRPATALVRPLPDGFVAGFDDGRVRRYDHSGALQWTARVGDRINDLAVGGTPDTSWLAVGADDGTLAVLEPGGQLRWSRKTTHHFVEELDLAWAYYRGTVRHVVALNGERLVAGLGDGYLHCLESASGREVWKYRSQWGCNSVLAVVPGVARSAPLILAGQGNPSFYSQLDLLSAEGRHLRFLARPLDHSEMASEATALSLADLDGDGTPEILHGTATHIHQLACWRMDGQLLWDLDLGERVTHLAAHPAAVIGLLQLERCTLLLTETGEILALARTGLQTEAKLPSPAAALHLFHERVFAIYPDGACRPISATRSE